MFKQQLMFLLWGLFIFVLSASESKNESIANSTDLNNEPAEINATIVSPIGPNQSYDVWTCRVSYNYQFWDYLFWSLYNDTDYGVVVQHLDDRFWINDTYVKRNLTKPMIDNYQYGEYDPWLVKHKKWVENYKFTSYKDMCNYWIKNKNAPLLGDGMKEIVKGTIWMSVGPTEHVYHKNYDCGTHFWRGLFKASCKTWERQYTATLTKTTLKYNSDTKEIEKIELQAGSNVFNCPWVNLAAKNVIYTRQRFKNFCQTPISVVRFVEEEKKDCSSVTKIPLPDMMGCSKVDHPLQSENTLVKVFNQGNSPYLLVPSLGLYLKNFRKCSYRVMSCHSKFFPWKRDRNSFGWIRENRTALCTTEGYIIATKEPLKELDNIYKSL